MRKIAEVLEFYVSEGGERLDRFLSRAYPEFSRTYIKKLIEEGFVCVEDDRSPKPSRKVREGERVILEVPEPVSVEVEPEAIPLDILYEDEHIAVISKPCGLVVHPSPGYTSGTLVNALLYHIRDLSSIGGQQRPGIVHRLDRETAGVMVVAKNDHAHKELSSQFACRKVEKVYKAVVKGNPPRDNMVIDKPIGRHPVDRKKFSVRSISSKPARTEFWVMERFPGTSTALLKVQIYTGRTHQIRVHLSSLGYPVVGDRTYGFKKSSLPPEPLRILGECNMLVAVRLSFFHPVSGERMSFEIEDPEPFRSVLTEIRKLEGSFG